MLSFAKLAMSHRGVATTLRNLGFGAAMAFWALLSGLPAVGAQETPQPSEVSAPSQAAPSADGDLAESGETQAVEGEAQPKIARADDDPQWLEKMLARNDEPMAEVDVAAADGFFEAKIAANVVQPVELMDDFYLVTFQFTEDEQSLGECYVFEDRMDLASSLILFSDNTFNWVAQTYEAVIESKGVLAVDSGHVDGAPYLGLAWLYRMIIDGAEGPLAGQAKHWMAFKEERSIYCQTSFIGHDQTFFDLFQGFVGSLQFQASPSKVPYFEEVAVMRVNGQNLGVISTLYFIDEDGDIERRESFSTLVPVDQQTLQAQDSLVLSYSDVDGEVIAEVHVEAEAGEVLTNLRLAPNDDATWGVTGTFQGKELEVNLGPGDPRSDFGQRLDFVEFMKTAEPGATLAHQVWTPSMDPSRWDEAKVIYKEPHQDGYSVTLQSGPMKLDGVIDQDMNLERVVMDLGGASMSIEGVFERGDVWHPKTLVDAAGASSGADVETPDEAPTETPGGNAEAASDEVPSVDSGS